MCPSAGQDFDLRLYFQSLSGELAGSGPAYIRGSFNGPGECDQVSGEKDLLDLPEGGAWLIRVYHFSGGAGSYSLDVHT
jgi:hypothetical protein